MFTGTGPSDVVERGFLKDRVKELFSAQSDIALFYFAGHGHIEATGGYLLASDARRGDEGLSLSDVLIMANESRARNRIIILDSCHSGIAGTPPVAGNHASLSEGLSILTASSADQYATEVNGRGVFTTLLVDALHGGAANLTGDITPGSIYAHVDQSLGAWEQRPIFKTNVRQFVSLRKVSPPIALEELRRIAEFFPQSGHEFALDPTYEPELKGRDPGMPEPIPEHTREFAVLQRYNRLNLVVPVDAPHMWHAAMQSKACKLTALGEHYRRLVENGRL
ncbi:caspase family protein, partial [Pandoraea oxalativorans]|uniref:caspase family protein n=1 Tax=Pandoraea oxalativorans TaxID=573737 RepID=UPI00061B4B4B